MSDYKQFICKLLSRSNLSNKTIDRFTSPQNMELFKQAVTHKSYSSVNYEPLELVGDPYINYCISKYVRNRFPKVVSLGWLAKLKLWMQSVAVLPRIARNTGIQNFILSKGQLTPEEKENILDDVIESFFGVIVQISGKEQGAALAVCYGILSSLLDELDIRLDYDLIVDKKTRVKEVFDSQGWGDVILKKYGNVGAVGMTLYRKGEKGEMVVVSKVYNKTTNDDAEKEVIQKAFIMLADKEKIPNPFVYTPKRYITPPLTALTKPLPLRPGLKGLLENILVYADVNDIKPFMKEKYLLKTQQSLVSEKYSGSYNNYLYKFIGDSLGDLVLIYYIYLNSKDKTESKLTKIRHSITKMFPYSHFWEKFGFEKFAAVNDQDIQRKDYDSVVRAFLGCLVEIIDEETMFGVGYGIVLNMIHKFFREIGLNVSANVIYDPITDLKNVYNRLGWKFDGKRNFISKYDEETKEHTIILIDGDGKEIARAVDTSKPTAKINVAAEGIKILSGVSVKKAEIITKKVVDVAPLKTKVVTERDKALVDIYYNLLASSPVDIKSIKTPLTKQDLLGMDSSSRTVTSKRFEVLTGRKVSVYGKDNSIFIELI